MATHEISLEKDAADQIAANKKYLIVETISDAADGVVTKVGDILVINKDLRRCVKAVRRYSSLQVMVHNEDHRQIIPNLTRPQVLKRLQAHFKDEDTGRGIIVYEIGPLLQLVSKKRI